MHGEETILAIGGSAEADSEAGRHVPELGLPQSLLYGSGGIAGGLVFTMMNNALPLFLLTYTMPLGLPAFFNPGGAIPATLVGLLTNERSIIGGLMQPIIGHISDRTSSRIGKRSPYLVAGGIGTGLAIASLALHPPFWLMLLAVTLVGIALYVAVGPYTALLADITPFSQRGRVGGFMALFGVAGAVLFSVLSILLWDSAREWVFLVTAGVVTLSMLVVALAVHEPKTIHPHLRAQQRSGGSIFRAILADRTLLLYTGAMSAYWLGAGAATPFITRFGVKELGIPERDSFFLLLLVVLATSVGAIIAGRLGDTLGRKRVLQRGLLLFAAAALAGSFIQNIVQAIPVMLLVGLSNAAPTALHLPLLADLVPRGRAGAYMGYAGMVWSIAQPLGSLLAGVLVDATGSYRGVFVLAGVCMFAASLLMRRLPDKH